MTHVETQSGALDHWQNDRKLAESSQTSPVCFRCTPHSHDACSQYLRGLPSRSLDGKQRFPILHATYTWRVPPCRTAEPR